MSDEIPRQDLQPITPPEPDQPGSKETQQKGSVELLAPVHPDETHGGIHPPTLNDIIVAAAIRAEPLRDVLVTVFRREESHLEKLQARCDKLQEELSREREEKVRLDERLKTAQRQTGAQVMLQGVGGVALGYGLDLARADSYGWIFIVIGTAMLAVGCYPFISLRWK